MDKTEAEDRGYVITVGVDMGENERYDISFVTADLSGDGGSAGSGLSSETGLL